MKILAYGETLMRFSPINGTLISDATYYENHIGGSELNCSISLAGFGNNVDYFTVLPENQVGQKVLTYIKSYGINTEKIITKKDARLGTYYYQKGCGIRESEVIYDRKNSAFANHVLSLEEIKKIIADVDIVYFSGIDLLVSYDSYLNSLNLAKLANKSDKVVYFDFNYRRNLLGLEDAKPRFQEIVKYIDVAFIGKNDIESIFEYVSDSADLQQEIIEISQQLIANSNINYIVSNYREVKGQNVHDVFAYGITKNEAYFTKKHSIDVIDRMGSGDALAAGFIHSSSKNESLTYAVEFAFKNFMYKHTINGDATYNSEEKIEQIDTNTKDVIR